MRITGAPANGTAKVNADGTISYTNNGAGTLSDTIRYTVDGTVGGTSNEATVSITVTSTDTTGPTPAITSTTTEQTKTTPIPYSVDFGETVTGFTLSDITVTGGTAQDFVSVSGSKYTFAVLPSADGTVTVTIPAAAANDSNGNASKASNVLTRTFDTAPPTVAATPLTTNDSTPSITGTVNDPNATVSITVNGVATPATVSGSTWTATLATALADGKYSIVATATDKAGNVGTSTLADGLVLDTVAPTVAITSTASNPTAATPIPVTITFSEAVTGFIAGDVTVTNGTVGNFVASSDSKVYTFDLTPTANGTVTVNVAAGVASDAATNANTAATAFSIVFNTSSPAVTLTSSVTSPTNDASYTVTATFAEDVTGFVAGDVTIGNGTISNFTAVDAKVYTFTVTPTNQGNVTVDIAAGVALDPDNNGNLAAPTLTTVFDSVAPTAAATALTTNDTTPTITGTTEAGSIVSITVNGETVAATVTGTTWSATLTTVLAEGTFDIAVSATDAAGNVGTSTLTGGLVIDTTAATVAITSTASDPTSVAPIPVTVTFNENVTGFEAVDVVVAGGTVSGFTATDAKVYTFNVTPTVNGTVTVSVAADVATDTAGNANAAATDFTITFNSTAPTVALTTAATDPTNDSPFTVTATFSEDVTGFVLADVTVVKATVGNFVAVDAKTYTFEVTPTEQGTVTISIAAGVATDVDTNVNFASAPLTRVFDSVAPVVAATALTTGDTTPTITGTTEAGSTVSITVNGETVAATVTGTTWTATLTTALADGTYDIVTSATDAAGNVGTSTLTGGLVVDATVPTATITSPASDPTSVAPIPVTVTFNENVTGFEAGDVVVTGGTVSGFTATDAKVYTFNIDPNVTGTITVAIAAGVATDATGNDNAAAIDFTITFNSTAPTVALTTAATDPTNDSPFTVTATFSEDVTGFVLADVTVVKATVGNFVAVDAKTYTFEVTPTEQGTVTISIAAGVATDVDTNVNFASAPLTRVFDSVAPVAAGTALVTNDSTPTLTGTVDDDTATVTVTVNGETVAATVTGNTWTATLTVVVPDGTYDISVDASDAAGNTSNNTLTGGLRVDATAPTVAITSSETSPTQVTPIPFTVTFSENVTGFDVSDLAVTNGAASNFVAVDAKVYTFNVTPVNGGAVTVNVAAAAASDATDNASAAATEFSIVFDDNTAPAVTLTSTSSDPTRFDPIPVTATFSEAVTGFELGDITVDGGTPGNFKAVDAKTYTFDVAPDLNGTITISIAAGVAVDGINTANTASLALTREFDNVAPTSVINALRTNDTTPTITGTVSEPGTTVQISANAIVVDAVVTGTTWTATFTTTFAEGSYTITSVTSDAAGNQTPQLLPGGLVIDLTAPSATITSTEASPSNEALLPVTVQFGQDVTGFEESDLVVVNGTISAFTVVDANTYKFSVTPLADGAVTIDLPADAAADLAGNGSKAATTLSIVSDQTAPNLTLAYAGTSPTKASPLAITATFTEGVTGFDESDLVVVNGTVSNFVVLDATSYTFDVTPLAEGTVNVSVAAGAATDVAGNSGAASNKLSVISDMNPPSGTMSTVASTQITGTALDGQSGVAGVSVSIFDNNGNYWDGTAFVPSATPIWLTATSSDGFANWSYAFSVAGTFFVTARITDGVGFQNDISTNVIVTP